MVNFAQNTVLSDEDQNFWQKAVTGAGPGVFLLLTFPPCCGSGGQQQQQQRPVDMWDTEQLSLSLTAGAGAGQMTRQPAAACRRNFQNLVNCLRTPHSVSWLWTRQMVALNKTCSKEMVFMSPSSDTFSIFS